jgi:hypothetical protein
MKLNHRRSSRSWRAGNAPSNVKSGNDADPASELTVTKTGTSAPKPSCTSEDTAGAASSMQATVDDDVHAVVWQETELTTTLAV